MAKPLFFKIGANQIKVGGASPLFVLLTQPIFWDSDFYFDGFYNFATLSIEISDNDDYESVIIKAIYYLNSHYLKKIGFVANLRYLEVDIRDPLNIYEGIDIKKVFAKATRVRNKERKNFISTEPLSLYNYAQISFGEQKFLYLYRILEYFWFKAKLQKLKEIRFDTNENEIEILRVLDLRNELQNILLRVLANKIFHLNQKKEAKN